MRKRHLNVISKTTPARACGGYNDGTLLGFVLRRKCMKGKIQGVGGKE
jgi:hypothetical protein